LEASRLKEWEKQGLNSSQLIYEDWKRELEGIVL
jgi:hypothetical protein